jgi:hypothetical protein
MHGAKRNAYRILVGKPERKIPKMGIRCMQENNIIRDLREI